MPNADPALARLVMQLLTAALLAILFLQSGLDKVTDRKGNLEWLTGHFAKSPLARTVPLLLTVITALELAAGALSAAGLVQLLAMHATSLAFWGAALSGASLVCLFFGQRVAKDYAGAGGLVPYFLVTLAGLWLFAAP
jgi:ABC-type xylose transport system permease subunit